MILHYSVRKFVNDDVLEQLPRELQECRIQCDIPAMGTAAPLTDHGTKTDVLNGDAECGGVDAMDEVFDFLRLTVNNREERIDTEAMSVVFEHLRHSPHETFNVTSFFAGAQAPS